MLGKLGFDCGRVDGIFGPLTARALEDFQRNCGLDVDGICGQGTAKALAVISSRTGSGPGMATIRELERLDRVAASLQDLRIVLGQYGGLGALVRSVTQELRSQRRPSRRRSTNSTRSAKQPPPTAMRPRSTSGSSRRPTAAATVAYYSTDGFTSAGGQSLAQRAGQLVDGTSAHWAKRQQPGCA